MLMMMGKLHEAYQIYFPLFYDGLPYSDLMAGFFGNKTKHF